MPSSTLSSQCRLATESATQKSRYVVSIDDFVFLTFFCLPVREMESCSFLFLFPSILHRGSESPLPCYYRLPTPPAGIPTLVTNKTGSSKIRGGGLFKNAIWKDPAPPQGQASQERKKEKDCISRLMKGRQMDRPMLSCHYIFWHFLFVCVWGRIQVGRKKTDFFTHSGSKNGRKQGA